MHISDLRSLWPRRPLHSLGSHPLRLPKKTGSDGGLKS